MSKVETTLQKCRDFEKATGIRITGLRLLPDDNDLPALAEAKEVYNSLIRAAHDRYLEEIEPARSEYDESFTDALSDLLAAYEQFGKKS